MSTQLTPQPNLPSWTLPGNRQSQAPAPFDMNAILAAFAQMAQIQGAQRLQGQQQQLQALDPLGETARANSRPGGLTPQSSWEAMFPTRPSGAGFSGGMSYAPPTMNFADAAVAASPQHTPPSPMNFQAPTPLTGPQGNAQTDAAALAQNQAFAANPSAFMNPPKAGFVAPPRPPKATLVRSARPIYKPNNAFDSVA